MSEVAKILDEISFCLWSFRFCYNLDTLSAISYIFIATLSSVYISFGNPSFLERQVNVHHEWRVDWTIPNIHDRRVNHDRLLSSSDRRSIYKYGPLLLYLFLHHVKSVDLFDVLLPSLLVELLHGCVLLGA